MFNVYKTVNELPPAWDDMVRDNIFLNRSSLINLAILNFFHQNYHIDEENQIAFIEYKMKFSLTNFLKFFSLKIPINIIGLPITVSKCGYLAKDETALMKMVQYIKGLSGLQVILNAEDQLDLPKCSMRPEYVMEIKWSSMEGYLTSLRSSYRYRVKKAIKNSSGILIEELKNNICFDQEMYGLYEEVYNSSKAKLEKLDIKFFKNYPSKIFKFIFEEKTIAFIQLVENQDELILLSSGFKYELNKKNDLYMNMLLKIIEYGIDNGYKYINFGQNFEETKLRLGAQQHKKYMYVHHSNPLINFIIDTFISDFSCQENKSIYRVFKDEKE